jgi:transposase
MQSELPEMYERCGALDVHKETVAACIRIPGLNGKQQEIRTFGTMTTDLLALRDWLVSHGVTHVAMESTGVYWKPVYHILEEDMEIVLVNAAHVKNVPGHKTDVKDCAWLAKLMEVGLLKGSFVPPRPFRDLRDLTRFRKQLINDRVREVNRLHKILQDSGVKLSSVATDVMGVSGRAMIEGLIQGTTDPEVLADLAKGKLRKKLPLLQKALTSKFREHHAFMAAQILSLIDGIEAALEDISARIEALMRPFEKSVIKLKKVPGLEHKAIEDILAEITDNMSYFPTSRHIASWSAVCPGNNESAGKKKSGKTRHGNKWLRAALVQAARAAVRQKDSYFAALYRRLVVRRGDQKAIVAVAHSLLVTIYHMLRNDTDYTDLGANYFVKRNNEAAKRRSIKELERLGYKVTLEPVDAALARGV